MPSFPNLARKFDRGEVPEFPDVDEQVLKELGAAGIKAEHMPWMRGANSEVPSSYVGAHCCWIFRRAWYYWIATGPGVPPDRAEEFHKTWGSQVRVDGHAGGVSPLKWYNGFAVGSYHIDTQEGLNAFAQLLKSIYIPDPENEE